jgi:hypothetical protein
LYFIASSLWGIGEKKFLPKAATNKQISDKPGLWAKLAAAAAATDTNGSGAAAKRERKKQRRGK